jgi:hypothetical protein
MAKDSYNSSKARKRFASQYSENRQLYSDYAARMMEEKEKANQVKPIELNEDESRAVALAIASGNNENSPYVKEASNIYINLESKLRNEGVAAGLKGDQLESYIQGEMERMWPSADKTPISYEMMNTYYANGVNATNENRAKTEQMANAYQRSKNLDYSRLAADYGASGMAPNSGFGAPNTGVSFGGAPGTTRGVGSYGRSQQTTKEDDFLSRYYNTNP